MATGFQLDNQVYIAIRVNGSDLPEGLQISEILLQSGISLRVPVGVFELTDTRNSLVGSLAIVDGTKIEFDIGRSAENFNTYSYRVFSVNTSSVQGATTFIRAVLMLDAPSFTTEAKFDYYEGSAVDILKTIADNNGLTFYSSTETNDSMVWHNLGKTSSNYIVDVADHAYVDTGSFIKTCVDINGELVVSDLNRAMVKDSHYSFLHDVPITNSSIAGDPVRVTQFRPTSISGVMNHVSGYGKIQNQHSLEGEDLTYETIEPEVQGAGLPLNSEIHNSIVAVSMQAGSYFDVGIGDIPGSNMHGEYYRASYQNKRYGALFSDGVRVLTEGFFDIPVMSPVQLLQMDTLGHQDALNEKYSGKYIVAAKTVLVKNNMYVETYSLVRNYVGSAGNTPIEGGDAGPSEIVPEAEGQSVSDDSTSTTTDETQTVKPVYGQESTVLDRLDSVENQVDSNIRIDAASSIDSTIDSMNSEIDALEESFKAEADSLGFKELESKYGAEYNNLDAMMNEFQSALARLNACNVLNSLEALVVDLILPNIGTLFSNIADKLERVEGLQDKYEKDLNKLIAKGDIKESTLNPPDAKGKCSGYATGKLNDAVDDVLPEKCVELHTFDKLNGPKLRLSKLFRTLSEQLEDLLCAMGNEGEVGEVSTDVDIVEGN